MVFVAISLAFAGVALVVLQDRSVRKLVEGQVRAHAVFAANRLAAGVSPITAVDTGTSGFEVLQVLDARGAVLAASPQLAGAPALQPPRLAAPDTVAASIGSQMVDAAPLLVSSARSRLPPGCGLCWQPARSRPDRGAPPPSPN
jgi:hypothetical protein